MIITKLQKSFNPPRRMFRSLSIITMRKTNDQTRPLQPLPFPSGNKLIDDTLRVIREITKLSFPNRQTIGRDERIPEFETECAEFGEGGVADDETGLAASEVVERDVLLFVDLVVDDGVALGEGAAFDVLS